MERWERWDGTLRNCQDRYWQGSALNLNETSLEPVWVKDPELHLIFWFLCVFCLFISFLFHCNPVFIGRIYRKKKSKPFHLTTKVLFFAMFWSLGADYPFSLLMGQNRHIISPLGARHTLLTSCSHSSSYLVLGVGGGVLKGPLDFRGRAL